MKAFLCGPEDSELLKES